MLTISATDAKQTFATVLEKAAREPVLIQKQKRDVAVVLSIADYQRLTRMNIEAFRRFCDEIGARAEARGMTEAKLDEILNDDA